MKIEEVKVEDLVPYDNNPRKNAASVRTVAASIKAFGFKVPIVIDERNVIVAGHTRLMAAKELGLKKVPCVVASDLNEDQIKAFRLADNKVGETSSWDWDKLEEELAGMEIAGIDMTDSLNNMNLIPKRNRRKRPSPVRIAAKSLRLRHEDLPCRRNIRKSELALEGSNENLYGGLHRAKVVSE